MAGINLRKSINRDALKAKFEQEEKGGQTQSDFLPYFKLKSGDTIVLRFLQDANPDNQDIFAYTETVYNINGKNMKFGGEDKDCPSAKLAAALFQKAKEVGEETELGKKIRSRALNYYKKRKYLANCYIVDAPDYWWEETGLNPNNVSDKTKVASLPKTVYEKIKDTVVDEDFEDVNFVNFDDDVVNFKLTVKKNSMGYNDYSASKFEIKPKTLKLDDDDIDVIAENLKDLSKIFKLYSNDDFLEALKIEIEDEELEEVKEVARKILNLDISENENVVKKAQPAKTKIESNEEKVETENSVATDEEENDSDIDSIRSGILNKLKSIS
jgi:hypothetical protein